MRRLAETEFEFTRIHPELKPWFHDLFSRAVSKPPARGRGMSLASIVPERVPWLGPRVWKSADIAWKQALAPYFLEAWDELASAESSSGS